MFASVMFGVFAGLLLYRYLMLTKIPKSLVTKMPWYRSNYDDTDKNNKVRSGLNIYVDYGTGVQYLSGPFGLTPRLNAVGNIMLVDTTDEETENETPQ